MIRPRQTHLGLLRLVLATVTIVIALGICVQQVPAQCQTGVGLFDYGPHREDALAEYLAMELSPALRAPDDEYDRVHRDLELIRAVFPPVDVLRTYRRYVPNKMLVRVDVNLPQDAYNQLNAFYQVIDDHAFTAVPGLHVVTFCDTLNIPTLVAEYEALPEVLYAEPDYIGTIPEVDPDDAVVTPIGTTYRYLFSRNVFDFCGGPCPCFMHWSGDVLEDGSLTGVLSWASGACVADCCLEGRGCILADLDTCSREGGTQVDECRGDGDGDGIDDACTTGFWPDPPQPELITGELGTLVPSTKNRYLSFEVPSMPAASMAVRVTLVDLPPPHDLWNGQSMWVGDPRDVSACPGLCGPLPPLPPFFKMATLRCGIPTYRDWRDVGMVHVYHEAIIPGGTYHVEVVDAEFPSIFSDPLEMTTAKWGDTVETCSTVGCTPPDGSVDIVDALAILRAFARALGSIIQPRTDLEPACVDFKINVSDVLHSIRGFTGLAYPFAPSAADPCNSTCVPPLPQ